jgi:hypothetical protein
MAQETTQLTLSREIQRQLSRGLKQQQIEAELMAVGHEEYFVKQIISEAVKLRNAQNRMQALIFILAGAAVCLLSCVLTMTASLSEGSFSLVLYGLTTVGILLVFAGLVKIF